MKKIISTGLLALSLFAFCGNGLAADFKIATVDLRKVFDTYYKTILASAANSNSIVERDKQLNALMEARRKFRTIGRRRRTSPRTRPFPPRSAPKAEKPPMTWQFRSRSRARPFPTTTPARKSNGATTWSSTSPT